MKTQFENKGTLVALGVAGMVSWLLAFGVGTLIPSQPYRDQLTAGFNFVVFLKALLSFTPTNVAILATLAGFLGGCASLLFYWDYKDVAASTPDGGKPPVDEERLSFLVENPLSSALRGFAVFLTFLAGTVLAANAPFTNPTQDQYCRMAGGVAVLAFAVGYDPTAFRQLISALPRPKGKTGA